MHDGCVTQMWIEIGDVWLFQFRQYLSIQAVKC